MQKQERREEKEGPRRVEEMMGWDGMGRVRNGPKNLLAFVDRLTDALFLFSSSSYPAL